ncbi:MAG: hypothetical protein V7642_3046 [Burkholderiales bacterium]|jgi:cyclopropane fatty-acyl-phospholipid synthase-like methyltransferase
MLDFMSIVSLLLVAGLCGTVLAFQFITGVPPLSSLPGETADVVALLKQAGIKERAIVYELGCGWGSLVVALAKAFPHAQIRGIELSPLPYWVARFRTRRMRNVHLQRRNFYECDLAGADAVTCYMMIKLMPRLAAFLDRTLKPGAAVVSVAFLFRDRQVNTFRERKAFAGIVALYLWPAQPGADDRPV